MSLDVFERDQQESIAFARQHLAQDLPPLPPDMTPTIATVGLILIIAAVLAVRRARSSGADLSASGIVASLIVLLRQSVCAATAPFGRFARDVRAKAGDKI